MCVASASLACVAALRGFARLLNPCVGFLRKVRALLTCYFERLTLKFVVLAVCRVHLPAGLIVTFHRLESACSKPARLVFITSIVTSSYSYESVCSRCQFHPLQETSLSLLPHRSVSTPDNHGYEPRHDDVRVHGHVWHGPNCNSRYGYAFVDRQHVWRNGRHEHGRFVQDQRKRNLKLARERKADCCRCCGTGTPSIPVSPRIRLLPAFRPQV